MSSARILILTNGPLARNPRVVKEATTLGAAGYRVTVITPRNHAASEPFDQAITADAPFQRVPIDLIPGYGTSAGRVFARLLRHRLGRAAMNHWHWPNLHALGPASCLLRAARAHPADLTLVHNEVPHAIGLRLLEEGRRVAADFEDWHSEDLLPDARRLRPIAILRTQERALLHRAAYVTTTSAILAAALQERYGGPLAHVITNSFPLGPVRSSPTPAPPKLLWFSQTIGPGRGLEAFLATWSASQQPSQLTLLGEDYQGFAAAWRERLPLAHRARLQITPLVPPHSLPAFIAQHDIGLALEPGQPASRDLTITNKILQYLNAGLAIVATPTAGQREVLAHAPLVGTFLEPTAPAAENVARLDALLADPTLPARRAAARQLAATRYCWEKEAPRLVALVASALAAPIHEKPA